MFKIILNLVPKDINGVVALDRARALGLPDTTHLWFVSGGSQKGAQKVSCEVGEAFARAYFAANHVEEEAIIPEHFLALGDVRMACEGNSYAVTFADLSPARVKELYLAVRFAACRYEVQRLETELDELRQPANADDEE